MTAIRIGTEKLERERGYLYYLGIDGYLTRTPIMLNKTGTRQRVGSERIHTIDGAMYFLDKKGYISAVPMRSDGVDRVKVADALGKEAKRLLRQSEVRRELTKLLRKQGDITLREMVRVVGKLEQ